MFALTAANVLPKSMDWRSITEGTVVAAVMLGTMPVTNVVKLSFRKTIWLCTRGSIWNLQRQTPIQTQRHFKLTFQYQENNAEGKYFRFAIIGTQFYIYVNGFCGCIHFWNFIIKSCQIDRRATEVMFSFV